KELLRLYYPTYSYRLISYEGEARHSRFGTCRRKSRTDRDLLQCCRLCLYWGIRSAMLLSLLSRRNRNRRRKLRSLDTDSCVQPDIRETRGNIEWRAPHHYTQPSTALSLQSYSDRLLAHESCQ